MSDYSQISGEHIVSLFRDHARQYGPNHVTTKDCEAELLRRLALRDQQVTLAMAQQNVMDTMVRVHGSIQDETYRNLLDAMYEHVPKALAQLPWPQGSGALHPLPKEGWREVDDALAASTQDAQTEVKVGSRDVLIEAGWFPGVAQKMVDDLAEAGLIAVPANLLDAVIAAVEMTEIPWKESQEWRKKEIIAAIRAAWEGATDER